MQDTATRPVSSGAGIRAAHLDARERTALALENTGRPGARQAAIAGRAIKLSLIRRR